MHLVNLSLTLLAGLAAVQAARYCQCENPSFGRIFPGINQVCGSLSNGWCATNCNVAGYNCDFCQWTPAGPDPQADYEKLKSWCFSQEGYDSGKQISYKGTEVNCYSYENKARCAACGGCAYSKSSFYKREALPESPAFYPRGSTYPLIERQGSDNDPNPDPDSQVVFENSFFGFPVGGKKCFLIFPSAAQDISTRFVAKHPSRCTSVPDGTGFRISCDWFKTFSDLSPSVMTDFDSLCAEHGGHDEAVDGYGDFTNPAGEPSGPDPVVESSPPAGDSGSPPVVGGSTPPVASGNPPVVGANPVGGGTPPAVGGSIPLISALPIVNQLLGGL